MSYKTDKEVPTFTIAIRRDTIDNGIPCYPRLIMHDTIYYAKVCRPNTHPMEKYHELQYKLWNTMNIIHITLALEKPRTSATICVYYQKIINCDQYITQHIQDNRQEVIHEIPSDAVHHVTLKEVYGHIHGVYIHILYIVLCSNAQKSKCNARNHPQRTYFCNQRSICKHFCMTSVNQKQQKPP
eukprot:360229_1